jgi:YD repeat-containing protein
LFILTAVVAAGCLAIPWAVRHWTVVFEVALNNNAGMLLREYADGRVTVTEYDQAGNPTTRKMKRDGDSQLVTMPSGIAVTHQKLLSRLREIAVSTPSGSWAIRMWND